MEGVYMFNIFTKVRGYGKSPKCSVEQLTTFYLSKKTSFQNS